MPAPNDYVVSVTRGAPRTIAAVQARLPLSRVPAEFARHLDKVYAARAAGLRVDGQNIFIYRDVPGEPGIVDAEFGVGTASVFAPIGDVHLVQLPVGDVATTTHWGSYAALGGAHQAVIAWCNANGRVRAGPRWEVYGHWNDNETPRTDIYYLLQAAS